MHAKRFEFSFLFPSWFVRFCFVRTQNQRMQTVQLSEFLPLFLSFAYRFILSIANSFVILPFSCLLSLVDYVVIWCIGCLFRSVQLLAVIVLYLENNYFVNCGRERGNMSIENRAQLSDAPSSKQHPCTISVAVVYSLSSFSCTRRDEIIWAGYQAMVVANHTYIFQCEFVPRQF